MFNWHISLQTAEAIHDAVIWAYPLGLLMVLWYAPKYGIKRFKAILYAALIFWFVILVNNGFHWVAETLGFSVSYNGFRSYLFIPLFALVMKWVWKIPVLRGLDFLTPTLFFIRSVVFTGCSLLGCALALPCDWGTYNPQLGIRVFPMDLMDVVLALAVGVIALLYARKLNYDGNGRVFALAIYITGVVRLFMQFGSTSSWGIRGINEETVYSVVAIAMAVSIFFYNHRLNLLKTKNTISNNIST